MCVTHPNPSTSAPYQPLRNARLFSPLGVSRGLLLLLLLACFVFTPSTSQAFEGITEYTATSLKERMGKKQKRATASGKQSLVVGKKEVTLADCPVLAKRSVYLAKMSSEIRLTGEEQMVTAVKAFLDGKKELVDQKETAITEESIKDLFEKYNAAMVALGRVEGGMLTELYLYEKAAKYGEAGGAEGTMRAIRSKRESNTEIVQLVGEKESYEEMRSLCQKEMIELLDIVLPPYQKPTSVSQEKYSPASRARQSYR